MPNQFPESIAAVSIATERELAGIALELAGWNADLNGDVSGDLSGEERAVVEQACNPRGCAASYRQSIRAGEDPLGEAFCRLRSPERRRRDGAVYTPSRIVAAMVSWAAANGRPARVVDPGAGSGRFLAAAAVAFPNAQLVAVEAEPLAALILRANATVLGFASRLKVIVDDYRAIDLPGCAGQTLFLGNPPYVRHHQIGPAWKEWLKTTAASIGHRASKLSGLHVHFLLKTRLLAREGDYGSFITSAEWLDVNYGNLLRRLVAEDLGGVAVDVINADAMPFSNAATTGAIMCFCVGRSGPAIRMGTVASVSDFDRQVDGKGALAVGKPLPRSQLAAARRWTPLLCRKPAAPGNFVELGELCRVHRGQVTGCNRAWIAGHEAQKLPSDFLKPTVTKAREIISAAPTLMNATALNRVVDLPVDLDSLDACERQRVEEYLAWAKTAGADRGYVARHRPAWWAVRLRSPAPILCTYMARRPPAFVRNLCGARHLNIAHGLYPREPLPPRLVDALTLWLQYNVSVDAGRTYAGGLTKFEPKEVERLLVPPPDELYERTQSLDHRRDANGRGRVAGGVSPRALDGAQIPLR